MDFINNLENIGIVIYILKILSISIFTYNFAIRIINKKDNKNYFIHDNYSYCHYRRRN